MSRRGNVRQSRRVNLPDDIANGWARAACRARAKTAITGNVLFSMQISGTFRPGPVAISTGYEANSLFLINREFNLPKQGIWTPGTGRPRPVTRSVARSGIAAGTVAANRPNPHRRGAPGHLVLHPALRPQRGRDTSFVDLLPNEDSGKGARARSGGGPASSAHGRLDRHRRPFHFRRRAEPSGLGSSGPGRS